MVPNWWGPFALLLLFLLPAAVLAHEERTPQFPDGSGSIPAYRADGPYLVVCKNDTLSRIRDYPPGLKERNQDLYAECVKSGFEHIQAAVNAVPAAGYRILVMPGVYREEPSLAPPSGRCAAIAAELRAEAVARPPPDAMMGVVDEGRGILLYESQVLCPHLQNLVAVLGDDPADPGIRCGDSPAERLCNLQIEGTGARPEDVVVDGQFRKLNVLRADRADGFYLRNITVQKATFNSVYILEQDGFVVDRVVGRYADEYGFLTFDVDHGLYVDCEAYGNGDSGLYPGSASDLHGVRFAVEITRCDSHHNTLGYSGTAGNSVYAHDNRFHHNGAGIATDSLFPNHPGMPQDSAVFRRNLVYSNNENYFRNLQGPDAPCRRPIEERDWSGTGTVCPVVGVPVGTGIIIAGGNNNTIEENWIYDNWRYGTLLFTVPAPLRKEYNPFLLWDTSHFNRYLRNTMGADSAGAPMPNGLDFWWDGGGAGNCWQENRGPRPLRSDPGPLPGCGGLSLFHFPNFGKVLSIFPCVRFSRSTNPAPADCNWMMTPLPAQ